MPKKLENERSMELFSTEEEILTNEIIDLYFELSAKLSKFKQKDFFNISTNKGFKLFSPETSDTKESKDFYDDLLKNCPENLKRLCKFNNNYTEVPRKVMHSFMEYVITSYVTSMYSSQIAEMVAKCNEYSECIRYLKKSIELTGKQIQILVKKQKTMFQSYECNMMDLNSDEDVYDLDAVYQALAAIYKERKAESKSMDDSKTFRAIPIKCEPPSPTKEAVTKPIDQQLIENVPNNFQNPTVPNGMKEENKSLLISPVPSTSTSTADDLEVVVLLDNSDSSESPSSPDPEPVFPKPELTVRKAVKDMVKGIQVKWDIPIKPKPSNVARYELYMSLGTNESKQWKKLQDFRALPLPMSCDMLNIASGKEYYFLLKVVYLSGDHQQEKWSDICKVII